MRSFKPGSRGLLMFGLSAFAVSAVALAGCGGDDDGAPTATSTASTSASGTAATGLQPPVDVGKNDSANLTGTGATFPAPIYQAWFDDYNGIAKGVKVNYQSVGSGAGISQFTANTVDFGASDAPMSDSDLTKAPDAQHLPTVIGAVTLAYNISGVTGLKLDGPAIAGIFLGTIKKWDDPAIKALNSGVNLPSADIQIAYRSDSSGTTFVFTDYLTKVSPEWKAGPGTSKAPAWPVGQGGQGNEGVTNVVKQTPNSIGYVELNYAIVNKLSFADVKNKAGKFVKASIDSASAAAAGVTIPDDYRVSITNADGDASYPISSFTFILLYKTTGSCSQQTPLVNMLWWVYHDTAAQKTVGEENYAPLPASLLPRIEATLKSLKCDGGSKSSLAAG